MAYTQRTGMATATQSILTDDSDFLRFIVERVVQEILEAEMTAHLHADPYERSSERQGYRNGYKPRQLNTRVGTLTLQLPQDRDGTFSTQLFARYQRNEKALVLAAWCELRTDFRAFRVDRIQSVEAIGERYPRRRAALIKEWRASQNLPATAGN